MKPCAIDGCDGASVAKGPYCAGHERRRRLGQPMGPPIKRPRRGPVTRADLAEAALAYADADSSDDRAFKAAFDRLEKLARRYKAAFKR